MLALGVLLWVSCVETRKWRDVTRPWNADSVAEAELLRVTTREGDEVVLRQPEWVDSPAPAVAGLVAGGGPASIELDRIGRLERTDTGPGRAMLRGVWGTALLVTALAVGVLLLLSDGELTFR